MVINENNSWTNSFTKGMNSDTAYDQIQNTQYVFGQNIRITKNRLLGNSGEYSSVHEGIVAPVPNGVATNQYNISSDQRIIAVESIDDISIVITTNGTDLRIYKFHIGDQSIKEVWYCQNMWTVESPAPEKISTVLYKELENVTKLYIANGVDPVISLRVDDESDDQYIVNGTPVSKDSLINNRQIPNKRVYIEDVISGRLTTSQVQYTYRYYNKYGNTTQLAPLTNKIQIIDPSRTKDIGNAEDTTTSLGLKISIDTTDYNKDFKRLQIFRLSYITPMQDAEVALIYDGDIKQENVSNVFMLNDVGIDPLQTYSMDEFSAMSGMILVPQIIEQNQEYMFCGNIKDDTILKGYKLQSKTTPQIITASVVLSDKIAGDIPDPGKHYYKNEYNSMSDGGTVTGYLQERGVNPNVAKASYNDIITSSLLRSLRRGEEEYRYAIVYYDNQGRRTDVLPLQPVITPSYSSSRPFEVSGGKLIAHPMGVKIPIPQLQDGKGENIVGCQIVRRSSSDVYQKTLLQVALARPISQALLDTNIETVEDIADNVTKKSPFYPSGLLCALDTWIFPTYYYNKDVHTQTPVTIFGFASINPSGLITGQSSDISFSPDLAAKTRNHKLYQAFSSEIDYRRNDVLSRINTSDAKISEVLYVPAVFSKYSNNTKSETYDGTFPRSIVTDQSYPNSIGINRILVEKLSSDKKQSQHWVFNFYSTVGAAVSNFGNNNQINQIKDVKIPEWSSAFTEVQKDENQDCITAIKKYKSYATNIDSYTYNNWVSFAKYDLRAGSEQQANMDYNNPYRSCEIISRSVSYRDWEDYTLSEREAAGIEETSFTVRYGYIGPGSSCFILTTENETGGFPLNSQDRIYTSICNITHEPKTSNVESDEFIQYFGFGNYFNLIYNNGQLQTEDGKNYLTVFDGDIYITPHELTTMYKAYDFNSVDTLQSTQITNYIPLESKVNTYFDYGMNLMNTQSENLLYEPGHIDGITTQERPAHQYNMIYSDNDASNDVFTLISTDDKETNEFKQRAYYSDLKTNGELIDNFLIFKATCFIDVNSRYGQLTEMLTDKNTLYYWQDNACGKFSVNERSLINDQNSNTIMLGQAGILSRYDYISTRYGMRLHDFCARSTENGVFWVDIISRAIAVLAENKAVNYGESLNVQNIINNKMTDDVPEVDYDLQNDELLCKCFGEDQAVFNIKYNLATSIYTRRYNRMLYINNHLYGLSISGNTLNVVKHNYLNQSATYLSPILLSFIVNPAASITKVFDSQQFIPIKRDAYTTTDNATILSNTTMAFETDLVKKTYGNTMENHTDREGNIIYNVPRYSEYGGYGNRIRGKWMKVDIQNTNPKEYFTVSHIITKFRQSYS